MKRLSTKIILSHIILIVFLTFLIILFSFRIIRSDYESNLENNLISLNNSVQNNFTDLIHKNQIEKIDSVTKKIGKNIHFRITITTIDGKVIGDSQSDISVMDNHKERPEIKDAIIGKIGKSVRYSSTIQKDMIYIAMPLYINNSVKGVCRVSYYASEFDSLLLSLLMNMIQISLVVILITFVGVLYFSRNLTKPIHELSIAASNVAAGDFDFKVKITTNDEISTLARNFNLMTLKLKELFSQVISQKEELNNLITSINEGLVSLNEEGRIILSNEKFNNIVETEIIQGKKLKKIIKEKSFNKLFKDTLKKRNSITREIQINDNYFLASSNYIESKNEVVILFHDITEIKKLELIKKDFVTNVSHELRTPLTAIKGFLETLYNEVEDNDIAIKYMNIMSRHTDRLIEMVQDLLTLSEIEDQKENMIFTEVNLFKFVNNVSKIFEQKLKDKNLLLKINSNNEKIEIEVDSFKIEQLFINLIDNAIKYTDNGNIEINLISNENSINIEIIDTGIGIPEEDLERIFERFYLVNKARTRKVGGTGLGLSIVKHIVLNHNGTIKVESKVDVGTKILIKLPIKQNKIS